MPNLVENKLDYKKNWYERRLHARIGKRWRERKYSKLAKCRFKNWKRITGLFNSPLPNCSNCKNRWILCTVLENSRILNQIIVEDCLTFLVNLKWFRVLVICSAATKCCAWYMESIRSAGRNVFGNQFSTFDSPRDFPQRISYENVRRNREAIPHQPKVKASLTSGDGQNNGTSSTIPLELPQNYVGGQQRQQISELEFDKFPNPSSFLVWKTRFKTQVSSGSDLPSEAMLWIKDLEMVDSLDES